MSEVQVRFTMVEPPRRIQPEALMWAAVLRVALIDAASKWPWVHRPARRFLLGQHPDFYQVCNLSGVSSDRVLREIKKVQRNGWRIRRSWLFQMGRVL